MWRGGELEKDMFKRTVWGTVFSFCTKIPCFTPPTNIHLSEQVFLHCYDKRVCIMKVGVKWPHSDPCVAFVSCLFEFRLFLSSLSPCRARRCVPQRLCVWCMKLGHFFLALLSLSARGSIQRYTKWWLETHGFIASLNTFPFDQGLGLILIDVFIIYCPHDVLRCTARHESGHIWPKEDYVWCVLFHAMFVFLSVYAQAHSVFYCLFIVFLQGYCNAYACVTHIFQV